MLSVLALPNGDLIFSLSAEMGSGDGLAGDSATGPRQMINDIVISAY